MRKLPILFLILISTVMTLHPQERGGGKILIAYFTWARNKDLSGEVDTTTHASVQIRDGNYKGDTEIIAEWIRREVGGDLFSIETVSPYASDFRGAVDQGGREQRRDTRPELSMGISRIADYDVIFLGYPVWWRDVPMALYTFMDDYDLSGKTIIPFAAHMGGGLGDSVKTIQTLEPGASVLEPLVVSDYSLMESQKSVRTWLDDVLE